MKTSTATRFTTTMPDELLERIEAYKEDNYLPSRNAAILALTDKQLTEAGYPKEEGTKK